MWMQILCVVVYNQCSVKSLVSVSLAGKFADAQIGQGRYIQTFRLTTRSGLLITARVSAERHSKACGNNIRDENGVQ